MTRRGAGAGAPRPASLPTWIARFAAASIPAGAYHVARCLGFPYLSRLERALPAAGRVLDILCGDRAPGRRVIGIDRLETRVAVGCEVLRRHGSPANVELRAADAVELPP